MSEHVAGVIPIISDAIDFNMPWHTSLMPIGADYNLVERAVHSAALAGCDTIWIVLHRESQPLIRKKLGEWIYDPFYVWRGPNSFEVKREVPIYYVCIRARDRSRRDSQAWSALYGAKIARYVSLKISKWVTPKRYLVVSPYGVMDSETFSASRPLIRGDKNIIYNSNGANFLSNNHMPFTFGHEEWQSCDRMFKDEYIIGGDNKTKTWDQVYSSIDTSQYFPVDCRWHHDVSSWNKYHAFLRSEDSLECIRPKYMVTHKWHGLVKDKNGKDKGQP